MSGQTAPADDALRERIDAALSESMDRCSRCRVCDEQVDAVMAVVAPALAEAALDGPEPAAGAIPGPAAGTAPSPAVLGLLEDAWGLLSEVSETEQGTGWQARAASWRQRYQALVREQAQDAGLLEGQYVRVLSGDYEPCEGYLTAGDWLGQPHGFLRDGSGRLAAVFPAGTARLILPALDPRTGSS